MTHHVNLSEDQLITEVKTACGVLIPSKEQPLERDEWTRRQQTLQHLAELAAHGSLLKTAQSQHVLSRWLRRAITVQLGDPRSAIVKATCAFVMAFAEGTSPQAATSAAIVCSWWVAPLFKCTSSTTLVVAQAAQQTLDTLTLHDLWNFESTSCLVQACESRHSRVRHHALETLTNRLQRVLGTCQLSSFSAFRVPLRRVLRAALTDADPQAREAARIAFVAFEAVFPDEAVRVASGLHPATRTALARSRSAAQAHLQLVVGGSTEKTRHGRPEGGAAASPTNGGSVFDLPPSSAVDAASTPTATRTLEDDLLAVAAEKARQVQYVPSTQNHRHASPQRPLRKVSGSAALSVCATRAPSTPAASPLSLALLRTQLSSSDWSTRHTALRALLPCFPAVAPATGTNATPAFTEEACQAIMELVVPLVGDVNVRVAESAHVVVRALAQRNVALVQPYLQHLCDVLLKFTASPRKDSRHAAVLLLETLVQSVNGGLVCAAIGHALAAEPTPAVRLRAVDLLTYTIAQKINEVEGAGTVPSVLRSIALELVEECAQRARSPIWSAAVEAIACLYDSAPDAFAKGCAQLTGSELAAVSDALRQSHPELDRSSADAQDGSPAQPTSAQPLHESPLSFQALVSDAETSAGAAGLATTAVPKRQAVKPTAIATRRRSSPQRLPALPAEQHSTSRTDPDRVRDLLISLCQPSRRLVEGLHLEERRRIHDEATSVDSPSLDTLIEALESAGTSSLTGTSAALSDVLDTLNDHLLSQSESPQALRDRFAQLVTLLSPLASEATEPSQAVRRRAVKTVRVLVTACLAPQSHTTGGSQPVASKLTALFHICRRGFDDAFIEVQQESALLLSAVTQSSAITVDEQLNALSECLGKWLRGRQSDDATRGWMSLLRQISTCLEDTDEHQHAALRARDHRTSPKKQRMFAKPVISRVCTVLHTCARHCAVEVRRVAMLTFAALWASLGEESYPFLLDLSLPERKIVTVLYNQAVSQAQQKLPTALGGYAFGDALTRPNLPYRDLNDELQRYEATDHSTA